MKLEISIWNYFYLCLITLTLVLNISCKSHNNPAIDALIRSDMESGQEWIIELNPEMAILHWIKKYTVYKLNISELSLSTKEYWIVSIGNPEYVGIDLKPIFDRDEDVISITKNAVVKSR